MIPKARAWRRHASLLRWLGPLAADTVIPGGVLRRAITIPARDGAPAFEAWLYQREGAVPLGSVLISPGLHFLGPADPRFDRFCRIVARSGTLVLAPFLPTYLGMDVLPSAIDELERALDVLLALPERPPRPPSVFSISFGSMPALRLVGRRRDALSAAVIFGGFATFRETLRFALTGSMKDARTETAVLPRHHDPLNAPVVVQNLLPFIQPALEEPERATLRDAFRRYCGMTWGRPHMKVDGAFLGPASQVAATIPEGRVRTLFLRSTRCEPGVDALAEEALARSGDHFAWIDPAPHLRAPIDVPITLVHGRDDDVIPFEQSVTLHRALTAKGIDAQLHLTGMFGHTGKASLGDLWSRTEEGLAEVRAMTAMLRALATL